MSKHVDRHKLDELSTSHSHQGVIAQISPVKYMDLDDFINKRIVNYDRHYDVKIYVSSENLTILRENINKFNGYIVFE